MEPVRGRDVLIYFNVDGSTYQEFGCAEQMNVEQIAEVIETSTVSTGVRKTWDYQSIDYTISLSGLVLNDDPNLTVWQLLEQQENFLVVPYRMVFTDPDGTVKARVGRILFRSIGLDGSQEDLASSTIQMQGSGPVLTLDTIGEVELTLQVLASVGAASMSNVIITDQLGIETIVHTGPLTQGNTVTVDIPAGTYHIRAELTTNQPYNLFESDALPGFAEPMNGPFTGLEHWPAPYDSPIWDFTSNRYLRFHASDVPIA